MSNYLSQMRYLSHYCVTWKIFLQAVRSIKTWAITCLMPKIYMNGKTFHEFERNSSYPIVIRHSTCQINLFFLISFSSPLLITLLASKPLLAFLKEKCIICLLHFKDGLYFSSSILTKEFPNLRLYFLDLFFFFLHLVPPAARLNAWHVMDVFSLLSFHQPCLPILPKQIQCLPFSPDPLFAMVHCFSFLGSHFRQGSPNPPALFKCCLIFARGKFSHLNNVF